MISKEEYDLNYAIHCAENALFNSFVSSGFKYFREFNEQVLNEELLDAVNLYTGKVTASLQKTWDNYKAKVGTKEDREFLKKLAPFIKQYKGSFDIQNYPNYNTNELQSYKIIKFDYRLMRDFLSNKNDFIDKFYPKLSSNPNDKEKKSIYDIMKSKVIGNPSSEKCDVRLLTKTFNTCSKDFYDLRKKIFETDIDTINNSIKAMQDTSMMPLPNGKSVAQEAVDMCQDMILEAPIVSNSKKEEPKMSFGKNGTNSDQKSNQNTLLRDISVYTKVSMSIFSAKMRLLRDMYKDNMQILRYFSSIASQEQKIKVKPGDPKTPIQLKA